MKAHGVSQKSEKVAKSHLPQSLGSWAIRGAAGARQSTGAGYWGKHGGRRICGECRVEDVRITARWCVAAGLGADLGESENANKPACAGLFYDWVLRTRCGGG